MNGFITPAMKALMLLWAVFASLLCPGTSVTPVTPIEQVVNLLTDLKTKVTSEGQTEASNYDDFACFCRSTTSTRSQNIKNTHDTIQTKSSLIESETATLESKIEEFNTLKKQRAQDQADLDALIKQHNKDHEVFLTKQADYAEALRNLNNAISSLENSKTFLQVRQSVVRTVELASVLKLLPEHKRQEINSFLQTAVDPTNPVYQFHSQGIIDVLDGLKTDFTTQKTTLETEWGVTLQTFTSTKGTLEGKINTATLQIDDLRDNIIPGLKSSIATNRGILVDSEEMLKDDQVYLNDLTKLCEARAKDWDQRSAMRAGELKAITDALTMLSSVATYTGPRALLLEDKSAAKTVGVTRHGLLPLLLQENLVTGNSGSLSLTARAHLKASKFLETEGTRLHSSLLSSVAAHVKNSPFVDEGNPFVKVKQLVQKLIERLITESAAEASKKGFCDETLGTARTDRDFRLEETQDLDQDIKSLEIKEDELVTEIDDLTQSLIKLRNDRTTAANNREAERIANNATIVEATDGLAELREAINILKVFYKQAAKAAAFGQISPVDEDTSGPGFTGSYSGQQTSAKAIFGLLEVIESDFDRVIRHTTAAEAEAHKSWVEFDQAAAADISGKSRRKEICVEDLATCRNNLQSKTQDLRDAQKLLDDALQIIETYKPTCIDTGMSWQERSNKRNEEISALNTALCILDPYGVEPMCGGQIPGTGR